MAKLMTKSMNFDTIYQFFQTPQLHYLGQELAVCYVLSVLCQQDSYGTALIENLAVEHPCCRLSDTILYEVIRFLEEHDIIESYWQRMQGRGRPRHMYHVLPDVQEKSQALAELWQNYTQKNFDNEAEGNMRN
jgi:DNA-binding PadR family transcriptional regulator